ncbi:MAG: AAA family ATPase [Oscillospiraceae bacterium]|nr:AAA family ATPase [Oscillospiraceae bacterium]
MARFNNECAVIGSVCLANTRIDEILEEIDKTGLTAEDFESSICRTAFEVIEELRTNGEPIDPVVIADRMSERTPGDHVKFIGDCMVYATTPNNISAYCDLVKDGAIRQRYIDTLLQSAERASLGDWKAEAATVWEMLQQLKTTDTALMNGQALADSFLDYYEQVREDPEAAFCKTGFADLDRQLGGGMFKSEVYIIGARPGMGKTTLGINIAQNVAVRGGSVLFVSLEMSEQQIMAKRLSLETGIRYTDLMTGRINANEEQKMRDWLNVQKKQPFFLTTKNSTVGEIARRVRQIRDLNLVIVDYIGLISCTEESRSKPRYEQMTEISASLKALAKTLRIPVLALCQLNRENVSRGDKRPTMADLRDSGAIEQDAGAIILLHRPDYYEQKKAEEERPEMETIELNVAKNRHAETGVVRMWWNGNIGKLMQQSWRDEMPPTKVTKEEDLPF